MKLKEFKPTLPNLRVLQFMVDHGCYITASSGLSGARKLDHWNEEVQRRKKSGEAVPKISNMLIAFALRDGIIERLPKKPLKDGNGGGWSISDDGRKWAWYDNPYRITDLGRKFVKAHKALLDADDAEKAVAEANEEYIITKARDYVHRRRDIGALCKVLRKSGKRVYVRVINTAGFDNYECQVSGRDGAETYVEISDIQHFGVRPQAYPKLVEISVERARWLAEVETQERDEITAALAPIRTRYEQRRAQKDAQIAEEIQEAMRGDKPSE